MEIQDEAGTPIEDFTVEDADEINGNDRQHGRH